MIRACNSSMCRVPVVFIGKSQEPGNKREREAVRLMSVYPKKDEERQEKYILVCIKMSLAQRTEDKRTT